MITGINHLMLAVRDLEHSFDFYTRVVGLEPIVKWARDAYLMAGADVLFAPGPRTREELGAIVSAVSPKPVNAIVMGNMGLTVADLARLGVRRISVGSALARTAWGAFMRAARLMAEEGSFEGLGDAASFDELNTISEA